MYIAPFIQYTQKRSHVNRSIYQTTNLIFGRDKHFLKMRGEILLGCSSLFFYLGHFWVKSAEK
jgi:hypothetical protein